MNIITTQMPDRAAFTIATGKPIYLEMACALARSFKRWNSSSDIVFYIVTDKDDKDLPSDLHDVPLIRIKPGAYGSGFVTKLHLDSFAPARHSLFIDADCICVGPIGEIFDAFRGKSVSVVGTQASTGEWQGDVAKRCREFNLDSIPRFNGGIYYLEKGVNCTRVFETARSLLSRYDDLGMPRLRGRENEEPLISMGMAINGETALPDNGKYMNCLLDAPKGVRVDVLRGVSRLQNDRNRTDNWAWNGMDEMRPLIVHLNAIGLRDYPYSVEAAKLELVYSKNWSAWAAWAWTELLYAAPNRCAYHSKRVFRPAFRMLFGTRKIIPSSRL